MWLKCNKSNNDCHCESEKKKDFFLWMLKLFFNGDLSKGISIQHLKSFVFKDFKKNGM
jgi:hypothetical protein